MLLSFIIPAYNAALTIVRCLNSIFLLPLSENDYEVIVIDDCSLDNTASLIERYAESHQNLTLLRQTVNHRQGAARNLGLKVAKGEHIAFVDSDDTVEEGIIKALSMSQQLDLDMVAMQYGRVSATGNKSYVDKLHYADDDIFSGISFQVKNKYWCCGPCAFLYRVSFLQSVAYPFAEEVFYEDADFVMNHLYYAKRMAYCPDCGYWAFFNPQSTTHSMSFKHVADYFSLGIRQIAFYQRIELKTSDFALDILEGGVWNINKACKHLWRLRSWRDVVDFYHRIDAKCHREHLQEFAFDPFTLTVNSKMILRHKMITVITSFFLLPIFNLLYR